MDNDKRQAAYETWKVALSRYEAMIARMMAGGSYEEAGAEKALNELTDAQAMFRANSGLRTK